MNKNKINIAIDGYSSCGKSTLAKQLAKELGYIYVDSGSMYRAIALYAIRKGLVNNGEVDKNSLINKLNDIEISFQYDNKSGKVYTCLNNENVEDEIRNNIAVSEIVSKISQIPEVRQKLHQIQQRLAKNKGVVMDGRDIGSVVLPDAELKIFMTADKKIRAQRRFEELKKKGVDITFDEVLKNLEKRDYDDTHRKVNPLVQPADAIVLDNSNLTPQEQLTLALKWAKERISKN
jgi:cytidylate kinase